MQLLAMHNTAEHDAAPPPTPASAARKTKADHPSIDMGVTTERWVYFQKRWNTYKNAMQASPERTYKVNSWTRAANSSDM